MLLAQNRPAYSLEITPEQVGDLDQTLAELAEVIEIDEEDLERFWQLKKRKRRFDSVPIRVNLSQDETAQFAVHRHRFPGVDIKAQLLRHYPHDVKTTHVLGYVGRVSQTGSRTDRYLQLFRDQPHRQERRREDLRIGPARRGRPGAGRGQRRRPQGPHAGADAARTGGRRAPAPGHRPAGGRDEGLRRQQRRGGGDQPQERRCSGLRQPARLRPQSVRRGHQHARTTRPCRRTTTARSTTAHCAASIRRGRRSSPSWDWPASERDAIQYDSSVYCPGFFQLPGNTHRYRDWKKGGHGSDGPGFGHRAVL